MYKAMHQSMRDSEKLSNLSDFAFRVWEMGCVASDFTGRITGNPKRFWAQAMPMCPFDETKYRNAFNELTDARLIHRYDVDGKPFMVFHDHDEHNKGTKNLRNLRPSCPPPPPSLCYCITYSASEEDQTSIPAGCKSLVRRENSTQDGDSSTAVRTAVPTADGTTGVPDQSPALDQVHVPVLEGGSRGESYPPVIRHLEKRAKEAKVAGRRETILSYLESWVARSDGGKVEQILMDPWTKGKTVIEIQEHFWPRGSPSNGVGSIQDVMDDWVKKQKVKA